MDAFIGDNKISLPHDVQSRFVNVLRVKPEEEVAVFDGNGREVVGCIDKNAHFVGTRVCTYDKPKPEIIVVQAALDEAKIEETVQRGSEFGVDRFIIFSAARSDAYCFAKVQKRQDRLTRIATDAARQSGRMFVAAIEFTESLNEIIASVSGKCGLGLFGDLASGLNLSRLLSKQAGVFSDLPCYIAIGPEGGLTAAEMKQLQDAGFHGVKWAPYVLRSELALLAPVTMLNAQMGRA